jgi:hypothetical protein
MKTANEVGIQVRAALADSGDFRACVFFDVRLDCIRVIARDCSVLETRINEALTVLEDNYYHESGKKRYVGFTIKGAAHFCKEHGFDIAVPVNISQLLDVILAAFPGKMAELAVDGIARPLVEEQQIGPVDLSGALPQVAY